MLSYKQTKTFLIHSLPMHPFSTPWKHQKTLHWELGKNALPWLKRAFWSVDLPKTLGRVFAFIIWPDVFLTSRVFDLKISGRVFSIKISWPSVLKHPAACLNFKHLAAHFTNAFQIWSWNYFTSYPLVLIFSCFYNSRDFWVFEGHISTATVLRISINQSRQIYFTAQ